MDVVCCSTQGDGDVAIWMYPRMVVERTYVVLGASVAVLFMVCLIVGYAGHLGLTEETQYDWVISETDASIRWDGYNHAKSQIDVLAPTGDEVTHEEELLHRGVFSDRNNLVLLWNTKDDSDIFTAANLQTMCHVENTVMGHTEYQTKFCRLDYAPDNSHNDECAPQPASILFFFYDSALISGEEPVGREGCPLLPANVVAAGKALLTNPAMFAQTAFFLGGDILERDHTAYARSIITLGGPVDGCPSGGEDKCAANGHYAEMPGRRSEQQETHYQPFWMDVETRLYDRLGMESYMDPASDGNLNLAFWGQQMGAGEFNETVDGDLFFSIGSILIVLCFLIFHTRSLFLGGFGMLQILLSMPCALFVYRTIFRVEFVTQLHVLAIYLVLGIGADDLFVFYDAWLQSAHEAPEISGSDLTRMNYAYKRAAGAMLTTSFTTSIAFIATASSPVMPISAFGYFAASCVIMNYVLVMTVFPALLMVWHSTGSLNGCCCNIPIPGWTTKDTRESVAQESEEPDEESDAAEEPKKESKDGSAIASEDLRLIERLFVDVYAPFINSPAKFGLVSVFLIYFIFSAYWALQMEPPVKPEQWFPDEHMLTRFDVQQREYVGGNDARYVYITLVWGVESVDREGLNRWQPDDRGDAIFDNGFDLRSSAAQEHIAQTCELLRTASCTVDGCMDGTQKLTRPDGVHCFIDDWRTWYRGTQCGSCSDDPEGILSGTACSDLIGNGANCTTDLQDIGLATSPGTPLSSICQEACGECSSTDTAACEEAVTYPSGADFLPSITEFRDDPVHFRRYGEDIGMIEGKLKYIALRIKSTMQHSQPSTITSSLYDYMEDFMEKRNNVAPAGVKKGYHCDGGVFTWMFTQKGLVQNVFSGLAICFPAAFIVLLLATHNLYLALCAILTVAGIVGCVLGVCKFYYDWGLGVAESIAAVIVIGFSVDFTVHLAHMYVESESDTRGGRMADSARTMGVTVTMGAMTTMGAGTMLWMCTLTFFTKFAVLICSTIIFSLTSALFFFMPLTAIVGPEGTQGDIRYWLGLKTDEGSETSSGTEADNDADTVATTENPASKSV